MKRRFEIYWNGWLLLIRKNKHMQLSIGLSWQLRPYFVLFQRRSDMVVKNRKLFYLTCIRHPVEMTTLQFHQHQIYMRKRDFAVECMTFVSVILMQYQRVTDRQTDGIAIITSQCVWLCSADAQWKQKTAQKAINWFPEHTLNFYIVKSSWTY